MNLFVLEERTKKKRNKILSIFDFFFNSACSLPMLDVSPTQPPIYYHYWPTATCVDSAGAPWGLRSRLFCSRLLLASSLPPIVWLWVLAFAGALLCSTTLRRRCRLSPALVRPWSQLDCLSLELSSELECPIDSIYATTSSFYDSRLTLVVPFFLHSYWFLPRSLFCHLLFKCFGTIKMSNRFF